MSQQHMEALQLANVVRLRTSRLKRSVSEMPFAAGAQRAAEILRDEPDTASVRIDELLSSIRRFGARRAGRLLDRAGIPLAAHAKRVGDLTGRQRNLIASLLEEIADGYVARRTA